MEVIGVAPFAEAFLEILLLRAHRGAEHEDVRIGLFCLVVDETIGIHVSLDSRAGRVRLIAEIENEWMHLVRIGFDQIPRASAQRLFIPFLRVLSMLFDVIAWRADNYSHAEFFADIKG